MTKPIDKLLREAELARAIYFDKVEKIESIRRKCKHEFDKENKCIHCYEEKEEWE